LKTLVTLKRLEAYLPQPVVAILVLNRYTPRQKSCREMLQRVESHFPEALLKTAIREGPALAQSTGMGRTIFEYKSGSHSAREFRALARELLERIQVA
jgi:chromosome partitioning protein